MRQLVGRDLRPGDIMLKANCGNMLSDIIQLGQRLAGRQNNQIVHAGLMFDNRYIVEAQSSGVSANDIYLQDKSYGYLVFRPANPRLGEGAGTCAKMMFDIHQRTGGMKYSVGGAIRSLFGGGQTMTASEFDQLLDKILEGGSQSFFCSRLVVFIYQFVAEQNRIPARAVFPMADATVSPAVLATNLASNGLFQEIGFLSPNERN